MKKLVLSTLTLGVLSVFASPASAQNVTVDPTAITLGFMNVFNITGAPGQGAAAAGAYQFGSGWGVGDLTSSFSGATVTLGPNQINDPSSYWYSPAGGPGAIGNKIMDANLYNETTGTYAGTTLTFSGDVLANSLLSSANQLGEGWTSVAFIKDFAPDYSASTSVTAPLNLGVFSISKAISANPGDHIQYGFETIGPDVWSTDVGPFGNIVIAPNTVVPEPATWAWAGSGSVLLLSMFRRRNK